MTAVRVPASSANLGPGFDALGLALALYAEVGIADGERPPGGLVDDHHPAAVAFGAAGGRGRLWVRSPIPIGRGLGFSGAMRAGGAACAVAQRVGGGPAELAAARPDVLAVAAGLEGHADNAAASVYGGVVATDGERVVPVATPLDPDVVVWIPEGRATATATSRTALPATVPFIDAVFNVGRTAVLVAALAAGDTEALAAATLDRLHQEQRFALVPESRRALEAGRTAGAWCGWLSGSGPSVVLLTAPGGGTALAAAIDGTGQVKVLSVDRSGVTLTG